jgi:nucleoside-diphosphate-sugar epimerase
VGDVKDAARLDRCLRALSAEVVFHAAAYKHVPLMENENAWEAVRNNVLGTLRVARAAMAPRRRRVRAHLHRQGGESDQRDGRHQALAEMVCQGLQAAGRHALRHGALRQRAGQQRQRDPKFREQIARGGPVTVTHPDIRYFMSIPEAAQLVLQAGLMGQGGEIFVLDMGEPVKIVDLARDMIRLSGSPRRRSASSSPACARARSSSRSCWPTASNTLPTPHPKLRIARAQACRLSWRRSCE